MKLSRAARAAAMSTKTTPALAAPPAWNAGWYSRRAASELSRVRSSASTTKSPVPISSRPLATVTAAEPTPSSLASPPKLMIVSVGAPCFLSSQFPPPPPPADLHRRARGGQQPIDARGGDGVVIDSGDHASVDHPVVIANRDGHVDQEVEQVLWRRAE